VKAVVMARGLGTRMRRADAAAHLDDAQQAAADAGLKVMIPDAAGRPFLDHILASLADAGVADVLLVTAPEHATLSAHLARHPPRRVRVQCVVQAEPRGTADAVLAAEAAVGDAPFLVANGDNLYPPEALEALVALDGPGLAGFDRRALIEGGNIPPERIAAFALVATDADGNLADLVEKPDAAARERLGEAALVSMNLWRFDRRIFAACREVAPSPRGEVELPEAALLAARQGAPIRVVPVHAGVLDLSARGDIATVARRLGARAADP
jgi:glucose-1-phosphate thymidylyltransferase